MHWCSSPHTGHRSLHTHLRLSCGAEGKGYIQKHLSRAPRTLKSEGATLSTSEVSVWDTIVIPTNFLLTGNVLLCSLTPKSSWTLFVCVAPLCYQRSLADWGELCMLSHIFQIFWFYLIFVWSMKPPTLAGGNS